MIIKMAFRNLFRHRNRTILTLVTMIVGILLSIVGEGTYAGMEEQMKETYIKTDVGYHKIYGKDFYEDKNENEQLEFLIDKESEKKIDEILNGQTMSKRLVFSGSITDSINELNTIFIGADKEAEEKIFRRSEYIVQGEFAYDENSIVIGVELAKLLDLSIGDEVTLIARTARKSIDAYDKKIVGIIKTGNPLLDGQIVFMPLEFAKIFADTELINDIVLGQIPMLDEIRKLEGVEVDSISLDEVLKEVIEITAAKRKGFVFISLGILLMAGISIANTMLMAMLERQKEIGIMMANGMSRKNILNLFLSEGILTGGIGTGIGFVIGSILVIIYEKVGIPLDYMNSVEMNIPLSDRLYMFYSLKSAISYALVGIGFSIMAAWYPAHKATKMNPVEVIRD